MPKPSIAVILGGKGPKPPESDPDMDAEDDEDEDMAGHKRGAMQEFIDAVHAKDVDKACEAFDALKALPDDEEAGYDEEK